MRSYFLAAALLIWLVGLSLPVAGSSISPLICGNPGSTTAHSNDANINANSCTDFSYSATLPQNGPVNNWEYGFYQGNFTPANFQFMQQQVPTPGQYGWWAVDFNHVWTSLDAFGGHPNSTNTDLHAPPYCDPVMGNCGLGADTTHPADMVTQWAVRRYVVPSNFNGMATITVSIQKDYRSTGNAADGDLNYVMLYHNGVATLLGSAQTPSDLNALHNGNAGPGTFPVQTLVFQLTLSAGDVLDFGISPNSNDYSDGEFQLITIQTVPEPASLLLVAGGLLLVGLKIRRQAL